MRGSIIFQPREGSGRKIIETIWRPTSTQKSKLGDLSSARAHKKFATATHQLIVLSRCHSDANFFLFLNERAPVAHPNRKIVKWWEFQGKGEHRRMLMISTFVTTQRRVAAVDRPQSTQGSFIGVFCSAAHRSTRQLAHCSLRAAAVPFGKAANSEAVDSSRVCFIRVLRHFLFRSRGD